MVFLLRINTACSIFIAIFHCRIILSNIDFFFLHEFVIEIFNEQYVLKLQVM